MTTTTEQSPNNSSEEVINQLHDLFSIGQLQAALSEFNPSNVKKDTSLLGVRLPFLLRCLAALEARSDITPSLKADDSSNQHSYPDVNAIAMLLEDVAAAHPGAENVELLLALAPSLCNDAIGKSIGKIPQLSKIKSSLFNDDIGSSSSSVRWDTKGLSAVLRHLSFSDANMNKRGSDEEHKQLPEKRQKFQDEIDDSDGDSIPPVWSSPAAKNESTGADANTSRVIHHTTFNANDSYESVMRRTLHELVSLVKNSLDGEAGLNGEYPDDEDKPMNGNSFRKEVLMTPGLSVKSDSLFAETYQASSAFGGGCSSLSVMVVILMYHAPVLRYDHVASALCRAAVPQASTLILHMAKNCAASIPCLLKGIISAYDLVVRCRFLNPNRINTDDVDPLGSGAEVSDIISACIDSVRHIASLSKSEASNVICTLRRHNVMDDLVLEVLIEHDIIAGASLIVEKMSACCDSGSASNKPTRMSLRRQSSSSMEQQLRPAPLRHRMLGNQKHFNGTKWKQQNKRSNLLEDLRANRRLVEHCNRCISAKITSIILSDMCAGEACLYLRAFAVLVHGTGCHHHDSIGKVLDSIPNLFTRANTSTEIPECSSNDDVYKLSICLVILVLEKVHAVGINTANADVTILQNGCKECLEHLLANPRSLECMVFSSRLAGFVLGNETSDMLAMILKHVYGPSYLAEGSLNAEEILSILKDTPSIKDRFDQTYKSALTLKVMLYDPIIIVEAIRRSGEAQCLLDELVKTLLSDPGSCRRILCKPMAADLIQESVNMLLRRSGPHIPLVLPFSLERQVVSLSWSSSNTIESQELCSQFVVQLLYALTFLQEEPASPFVINPRSFPLKEVMNFKHVCGDSPIAEVLKKLISAYCPDVVQHISNSKLLGCVGPSDCVEDATPSRLYEAMRDSLQDSSKDPSGMRAEKLYFMCSSHLTTGALVTTVCSAVLTPKHSQQKYLSYLHICKDPLVLFKAPALAWKCHGVRKMLLRTLCHLMEANEALVVKSSKTTQVATEFLASRNMIIVRCLLYAQTNICPMHCFTSTNLIRTIISKSPGITATLLKQGVDDVTIGYLCENIPESFSDAALLSTILSQKELFGVPERLVLANASLRIAIAHYSRGEVLAKALVNSSLSVLIESFQYVLGPIGVPVSVLRGNADGSDTTETCRTVLFSMIDALSTVNPGSILKGPSVVAIGKIASMCKSEGTSSSTVGARRKALLKEVWDACGIANTALGAEMQL